jgi:hypothetical protein
MLHSVDWNISSAAEMRPDRRRRTMEREGHRPSNTGHASSCGSSPRFNNPPLAIVRPFGRQSSQTRCPRTDRPLHHETLGMTACVQDPGLDPLATSDIFVPHQSVDLRYIRPMSTFSNDIPVSGPS